MHHKYPSEMSLQEMFEIMIEHLRLPNSCIVRTGVQVWLVLNKDQPNESGALLQKEFDPHYGWSNYEDYNLYRIVNYIIHNDVWGLMGEVYWYELTLPPPSEGKLYVPKHEGNPSPPKPGEDPGPIISYQRW